MTVAAHYVYLNLQYDNNLCVIEIGAIHVFNSMIQDEFHCFIKTTACTQDFNLCRYNMQAQNSHCIHANVLKYTGLSIDEATDNFRKFLSKIPGSVIQLSCIEDSNKLENYFSFLKDLKNIIYYETIKLPAWNSRQFDKPHISALKMKQFSSIHSCNASNHALSYRPAWKLSAKKPSHSQQARYMYGFNCALISAYEIAFYKGMLELFCCDKHFKNLYLNDTMHVNNLHVPPVIDYTSNVFNELYTSN